MGRVVDKLLLFLYSLCVLVLSAAGLLFAFGWFSEASVQQFVAMIYMSAMQKYAAMVVCAILLLLSLRFLYVALRRSRVGDGSIDQRTDLGDIRISLETVENLTLKTVTRFRGVKELRARVRVSDAGLEIQIRSVVDGDTSIPQLSEEMQRSVKQHIEEVTGIPVSSVTIYIANVFQSQSVKSRVE